MAMAMGSSVLFITLSLLLSTTLAEIRVTDNRPIISMTIESKTNTRGKTILPTLYFLLSLLYFILAASWIYVLYKNPFTVHGIHFFMLVVLILKPLDLLSQAQDNWYINPTGSAHGWDVLFYILSFFRGFTLFTLIALMGTAWSFFKPYLQDEENKLLVVVIPLQVVANIAQFVIDKTGPYWPDWIMWRQIFLLVDLVCCCAVLLFIVCSIENLREYYTQTDGKAEAAVNLIKLTLFRRYYVICYIYFIRVVVSALETTTSYKYLLTCVVAGELVILAFYVFTWLRFKPEAHYPNFVMDDEEELKHIET